MLFTYYVLFLLFIIYILFYLLHWHCLFALGIIYSFLLLFLFFRIVWNSFCLSKTCIKNNGQGPSFKGSPRRVCVQRSKLGQGPRLWPKTKFRRSSEKGLWPNARINPKKGLWYNCLGIQVTPKTPNTLRNRFTQIDHRSIHWCLSRG